MNYSLEDKIELELQAIPLREPTEIPDGYFDGMQWAFELVLSWIDKGVKPSA